MTDAAHAGVAIRSAEYELTHQELRDDIWGLRDRVPAGGSAVLSTDDAAAVGSALIALDGWAAEVRLIPPGLQPASLPSDLVRVEPGRGASGAIAAATGGSSAATPAEPTRWVLYTSGTTGEPKAITHTLASLTRTVVAGSGHSFVWGLLYDPNRMAGLQVLLQGLLSGATVVAPSPHERLSERVATLVSSGVNALSATPSLWRQILQIPASSGWSLEQITLGGEIADQRVLDALASAFPDARIVHVFASTETGAAFSVKDGREGFPVAYLSDPPRGIRLEIRDDILHVFSPGVSTSGDDGFAATGDVMEIVGDRVLFRGRSSGVVNVGGSNVWPEVVETILREHPDVLEAVVTAKPNAMTGNVLVARVVVSDSAERDGLAKQLRSWVRGRAPGTHVPASVSVVDELEVSTTGKVTR